MAQRIDRDKHRRQDLVAGHGSERSEFEDVGAQIAKAKGRAKIRGKMLRACTACRKYYDEYAPEEHVCHPPKSITVKCRKCGKVVEAARIGGHMRKAHPNPWWPNDPPKDATVKCRICGRVVKLRGIHDHNRFWHQRTKLAGLGHLLG
jgi:endogenous inhibitor of DNA gyrase (YacG/DUF329 family)